MALLFSHNKTENRLNSATLKFSLLSNFIALLGGKIKSKQMLSGNMSDILSNLYLCYSILWYHHHYLNNNHTLLRDKSIEYLLNDIDSKLNLVIDNYLFHHLRWLLYPLRNKIHSTKFENKNNIYNYIVNNEDLNNILKDDICYKGTVLEKMEAIKHIDSTKYTDAYQDIISVGEYKIEK